MNIDSRALRRSCFSASNLAEPEVNILALLLTLYTAEAMLRASFISDFSPGSSRCESRSTVRVVMAVAMRRLLWRDTMRRPRSDRPKNM